MDWPESAGTIKSARSSGVKQAKDRREQARNPFIKHLVLLNPLLLGKSKQTSYFNSLRKNGAVRLPGSRATSSGVPQATTRPPAGPASGPMSTI